MKYRVSGKVNCWVSIVVEASSKEEALDVADSEFGGVSGYCGNGGTLVFKWNELDITVSEIAKLSPVAPLFGHRSGKQSKTHWLVFAKTEDGALETAEGRGTACNSARPKWYSR